jgi:hypothetical protein
MRLCSCSNCAVVTTVRDTQAAHLAEGVGRSTLLILDDCADLGTFFRSVLIIPSSPVSGAVYLRHHFSSWCGPNNVATAASYPLPIHPVPLLVPGKTRDPIGIKVYCRRYFFETSFAV